MNLIELHMLQSFPVNCLNRDQFGSPKSTFFGGTPRARISSQCWKRAIRQFAQSESEMFTGSRSKYFVSCVKDALLERGMEEKKALEIAAQITKEAGIVIDKDNKVKNLFYFSPEEIQTALNTYFECTDEKKRVASAVKELCKIPKDGVDIAFFGRMVADSELTLEGAAMFSHAISVNRVDNDLDFFTAVDDLKPQEKTGSAHMGDIEFNTACYYRYVAINLDLLADQNHLSMLTLEERQMAVKQFLRSCVMAVPSARHNSMLASTLPGMVFGIARKGTPLSLANAFEEVIKGYPLMAAAQEKLLQHWEKMCELYALKADYAENLPEHNLNELLEGLTAYVK